MSVRIIEDTQLAGLAAFQRRFQDFAVSRVLVGVPSGAKEEDGTPIAMIAAVHEFGSPKQGIPERSFLRAGIKRGRPRFTVLNFASLKKVAHGLLTIHQALDRLGMEAASIVKQEIVIGSFAPLAAATIARKKSDKPLIDTGSLRQAITWEIEVGG